MSEFIKWALLLILIYILVNNFAGTVAIGNLAGKNLPPIIQSLQGVGPGYPPPAR
jgi:hypothetical protein